MIISEQPSKILFISTFPPLKCGIASFTQDLVNAIGPALVKDTVINICALDRKANAGLYEYPVTMVMDGHLLDSCMETAELINRDPSIKLLCIEHEFDLYGGELGDYLLGFLALIEKPFVLRFHTVVAEADPKRRKVVQTIGLLADKVLVMSDHSAHLLEEQYQINPEKILVIPHGTYTASSAGVGELKVKYRLEGRLVLTTFGLLRPSKGIEKGILAMKEIIGSFPEAIYVVLGHTHPPLLEEEGEKYRGYLQQLIQENHLEANVRLVNEFAPTQKLLEYLALTDVYLFTSRGPDQDVSGTFLSAMAASCPIISNAFPLATDMLDEHTGLILEPGKENALAAYIIRLLGNEGLRKGMGHNAFLKTRHTTWRKVAGKHTRLFFEILGTPVFEPELSDRYIS